jgi:hypothetical protein
MTIRTRQVVVAGGLIILAVWALLTWAGSGPAPQPTAGPSPTGAIGSAPVTFEPSDGTTPSASQP